MNLFRQNFFFPPGKSPYLCYVALALIVSYGVGVYWGLPSEFSSAVDSVVPYSPLAFIAEYSRADIAEKYPATHQLLLLPFYVIAVVFLLATGNLGSPSATWPYGFRDPVLAMSSLIVLSRVIHVLMAVGIILAMTRFPLGPKFNQGKPVAVISLAGSGVFTYYARVGNFDVPYLFWWVLSLLFLARYILEPPSKSRHILVAAILAALAAGTKDQAAGLVLGSVLILFSIPPVATASSWITRTKQALRYSVFAASAYLLVAVLPQPFRWVQHVKWWLSGTITDYIVYEDTLSGHLGLIGGTFIRLAYIISPPLLLLAVLGIVYLLRTRQYRTLGILLIPALSYYAAIIFNIRFVLARYMLPWAFLAAILVSLGTGYLLTTLRDKATFLLQPVRIALALALGYHCLTGYLPVTYVQLLDIKRTLANSLHNHVPPGDTILWRGGFERLPNSQIYENYRLILPPGAQPFRSEEHVFKPYDPSYIYVLSDSSLGSNDQHLKLLQVWQFPPWVKRRVFTPVLYDYYLYKREVQ